MAAPLHVILGSGGSIGTPLAAELVAQGERVRAVSRSARGAAGCEAVQADLTDESQTAAAVDEGSIVYLLVGLRYDSRVWRDQWPRIMTAAVKACEAKHARLLFFDNVYMYGAVDGPMTEETPVRPSSDKGRIRAQIAGLLLEEMRSRRISALIARAADFYGPHAAASSVPYMLALEPLLKGRRPRWLISTSTRHSYSYTIDCAKALLLLARDDGAFGQVWHLPTARPPITGEEFMGIAARSLGSALRYSVLSRGMLRLAGLFNRQIYELSLMTYQNDRDYVFDSSKFEKRFQFAPTTYRQGIDETLRFFGGFGEPAC
jgi:nucleoside-diphosphate-sugar epimerase